MRPPPPLPWLSAPARAQRIAVISGDGGRAHTYGELDAHVTRVAAALHAPSKKLVFLFVRNDLPSIAAYLGSRRAGHAVALFDAGLSAEPKTSLIERYRPDWIAGAPSGAGNPLAIDLDGEVLALTPGEGAAVQGPPHDDLAVLLSTSGTTGGPKLVRLSHSAVEHNAAAIAEGLSIEPDDRALGYLPFHYSYGLSILNSHLVAGASIVLTNDALTSATFWTMVRERRCTSMSGVPYSYEIMQRLRFERIALPDLKTMTQAGGRLDPVRTTHFHGIMSARGGRFFTMYGQTEATARITILPAADLPAKLGSVGLPLRDGEITIEQGGEPTGPHVTGEVVYRGPNVMMGYGETRAGLQQGDTQGGRLATGDLGYLDDAGYLYITGRHKRIAKVFGLRIDLDEIKKLTSHLGSVAATAARDRIVVWVEARGEQDTERWRDDLAQRIGVHPSAIRFEVVPSLPRTSSGKVDYPKLPVP